MAYEQELEFAKELAQSAGKIMREHFGTGLQKDWKTDHTPLTIADITINSMVIQKVQAVFPGDAVLGEEESYATDSDRVWVCDPVDGTMPYSHGLPISTFSLALVVYGKPVVGVVYDPFMDRLFYASIGKGAFCHDERLHVSGANLGEALIDIEGVPAAANKSVIPVQHGGLQQLLENAGAHTVNLWSVILPSVLVASGQFTATIFNIGNAHDAAAAKIIVDEAGGKMTDLFGNEQRYDGKTKGFIASNGVVHEELVRIVASL